MISCRISYSKGLYIVSSSLHATSFYFRFLGFLQKFLKYVNKLKYTILQQWQFFFPLSGLTWIFGILAIEDARVIFSYIFTILTTFQGFFIFILFVAREKQFRSYWRKLCCQRFSDKQKKYKPTSATHSSSQALTKLGLSNVQTESTDDLHSSN